MPAKPEYVGLGRLALSAVSRLAPFGHEEVADMKLAITEAATAFVGNGELDGCSPGADLDFSFELGDDSLAFTVGCRGGLSLSAQERELGQAIIHATVDEADYASERMRLVKYMASAAE